MKTRAEVTSVDGNTAAAMFLSSVQYQGFQTWAETAPCRVPRAEDD